LQHSRQLEKSGFFASELIEHTHAFSASRSLPTASFTLGLPLRPKMLIIQVAWIYAMAIPAEWMGR
jgi:hypothetical protein